MAAEPTPGDEVRVHRWVRALAAGSMLAVLVTVSAVAAPALPPPEFGRSVDIGLVSGVVIVKPLAGPSFRLGTQDRTIPVGSEIDTTKGQVDLRSAFAPRKASAARVVAAVQDGQFRGALFKFLQRPSQRGLTVIDLVTTAKMRRGCALAASVAASPGHLSRRVLQTLRAHDGSGAFRTRGRYSSATVRGTTWDTIDRCDGTLTVVHAGTVSVDDFARHKTILVHAGHRYLAKAR